jgi:hypothetical protein
MGNRSLNDLPGATDPGYYFVEQESLPDLLNALKECDFEVWEVIGSRIRDDVTLFDEVVRNLGGSPAFGYNWDAFRDVVRDLPRVGARRAIVWHEFSASLKQNLGVTLEALYLMREIAKMLLPIGCLGIYLLGQGKDYPPFVWNASSPS